MSNSLYGVDGNGPFLRGVMIDCVSAVRQQLVVDAVLDMVALATGEACKWGPGGPYWDHRCEGCRKRAS